jgi:hypothetical protein
LPSGYEQVRVALQPLVETLSVPEQDALARLLLAMAPTTSG